MNKILLLILLSVSLASCSSQPPKHTHKNVCKLFAFDDVWYEAAQKSEKKWGIPKSILLAFIHQESRFKKSAQPPREYWLGVIPLPRRSSAYGYPQAKDAVWSEYQKSTGKMFASRSDPDDALDFIGWYNHLSHKKLGISKRDAFRLYLAYHEGKGGYKRRTYRKKPWLIRVAKKVSRQAKIYQRQIKSCESNYRCNAPWPFCR